jgi:hypothetical protein
LEVSYVCLKVGALFPSPSRKRLTWR